MVVFGLLAGELEAADLAVELVLLLVLLQRVVARETLVADVALVLLVARVKLHVLLQVVVSVCACVEKYSVSSDSRSKQVSTTSARIAVA